MTGNTMSKVVRRLMDGPVTRDELRELIGCDSDRTVRRAIRAVRASGFMVEAVGKPPVYTVASIPPNYLNRSENDPMTESAADEIARLRMMLDAEKQTNLVLRSMLAARLREIRELRDGLFRRS